MSGREIDQATAESMEEDADFAGEHESPTLSDEPPPENADDESVPDDEGGGMETGERRRPE